MFLRESIRRYERVIRTEAEIDLAHLLEAAQQEARCGEQDQRNRYLRHDQGGAEARVPTTAGAGAAALFQGVIDAGANGGKGRGQTTDRAGEKGQSEGEGDHDPIHADLVDAR